MIPSLPQSASFLDKAARAAQLHRARSAYEWNHDSRVKPLGIAKELPKGQGFSPLSIGAIAVIVLDLLDNLLSALSRLLHPGGGALVAADISAAEVEAGLGLLADLNRHRSGLLKLIADAEVHRHPGVMGVLETVAEGVVDTAEVLLGHGKPDPHTLLEEILKTLAKAAVEGLLRAAGLYGAAQRLTDYVRLFNIIRPPDVSSVLDNDLAFARARLAGPNPMSLRGIAAIPANFPVTDAMLAAATGPGDTLDRALAEKRLYLVDYADLANVPQGTFPNGPKYMEPAMGLFATPPADAADRALRPVAIQLGQASNRSTPIFTPADAAWALARLHLTVADGNHHEMVSHLGYTHLVLEGFVMCTHRQLAPEHPLFVLLIPHFQGTLAINEAAEQNLIAPKGFVDRLLAGTIEGSTAVAVNAVADLHLRQAAFPNDLRNRGVDDEIGLPDYPYRDDGKLIWGAIHQWVVDYLSLYYTQPDDVSGDTELQAWVAELESPAGAGLKGVGPIETFEALADLICQVIFTASAQHAAVNFPQRSIMSLTPAFPLAAYTPAPTSVDSRGDEAARCAALAPLQDALAQQTLLMLLGGVYFTRLGDYDRYTVKPTFADPRVAPLLEGFQGRLWAAEQEIGARNLRRVPYTTLLPTAIPQSINI